MKIIDNFRRFYNDVKKSGLKGIKTLLIFSMFFVIVTPFVYVSRGGHASFWALMIYLTTSPLIIILMIHSYVKFDLKR